MRSNGRMQSDDRQQPARTPFDHLRNRDIAAMAAAARPGAGMGR